MLVYIGQPRNPTLSACLFPPGFACPWRDELKTQQTQSLMADGGGVVGRRSEVSLALLAAVFWVKCRDASGCEAHARSLHHPTCIRGVLTAVSQDLKSHPLSPHLTKATFFPLCPWEQDELRTRCSWGVESERKWKWSPSVVSNSLQSHGL